MKRFTVCLLTCAFSAIMITKLSSALIIQSHSQQIQFNEEDIPELGIEALKNWFHTIKPHHSNSWESISRIISSSSTIKIDFEETLKFGVEENI